MKYTKGPWILENLGGLRFVILKEGVDGGNTMIATLSTSDGNARLMATAPEMLEALEVALKCLREMKGHTGTVEAAIAKAKGE